MKIDYNDISRTYDDYRSYHKRQIQQIVKFGEIEKGMKILDLGCGTGNLSLQLSETISVGTVGLDSSFNMLEKANKKSLQVLCADADHSPFPFKDKLFDLIIGSYFIHYIKNIFALIKECYRILNNGSLVLITSSHGQIESLHPVIKKFFPSLVKKDIARFPEISKLDNSLQSAGFKDIKYEELVINKIPIDMSYVEKVRNRFVSTFYLLPENEFMTGVEKLEEFVRNKKETEYRVWRGTMIYGRKY
jgi:ubiquinone/menaquinone biosynthesis C-methylase UbiE